MADKSMISELRDTFATVAAQALHAYMTRIHDTLKDTGLEHLALTSAKIGVTVRRTRSEFVAVFRLLTDTDDVTRKLDVSSWWSKKIPISEEIWKVVGELFHGYMTTRIRSQ